MLAAGATPRPSKSPTVEQHILGAQDLISRGELEAAKERVEVALKEHPKAGGLYNLLGIIDAKENKLSSAANFERAIRLDPQLAGACCRLSTGVIWHPRKHGRNLEAPRRARAISSPRERSTSG
jgi:hypothetical protein